MTPYKPNSPKGQRPKPPAMAAWSRNPNEATEPRVQRLFVGSHQETGVEPKGSAGAGLSVLRQHYKLMLVAMKKVFTLVLALTFFIPSVSSATTLSQSQVSAIIALLYAFNVDQNTILSVQKALSPQSAIPTSNVQPQSAPVSAAPQTTPTQQNTPAPTQAQSTVDLSKTPKEISIQSQVCNLSQTNLKTDYSLDSLLANGNIDGRIFMNAYVLTANPSQNYYSDNPTGVMTITTSDGSNNKVLNGSGDTGPCGFYYQYAFYATKQGTYAITYSTLGLSKSVTITVK